MTVDLDQLYRVARHDGRKFPKWELDEIASELWLICVECGKPPVACRRRLQDVYEARFNMLTRGQRRAAEKRGRQVPVLFQFSQVGATVDGDASGGDGDAVALDGGDLAMDRLAEEQHRDSERMDLTWDERRAHGRRLIAQLQLTPFERKVVDLAAQGLRRQHIALPSPWIQPGIPTPLTDDPDFQTWQPGDRKRIRWQTCTEATGGFIQRDDCWYVTIIDGGTRSLYTVRGLKGEGAPRNLIHRRTVRPPQFWRDWDFPSGPLDVSDCPECFEDAYLFIQCLGGCEYQDCAWSGMDPVPQLPFPRGGPGGTGVPIILFVYDDGTYPHADPLKISQARFAIKNAGSVGKIFRIPGVAKPGKECFQYLGPADMVTSHTVPGHGPISWQCWKQISIGLDLFAESDLSETWTSCSQAEGSTSNCASGEFEEWWECTDVTTSGFLFTPQTLARPWLVASSFIQANPAIDAAGIMDVTDASGRITRYVRAITNYHECELSYSGEFSEAQPRILIPTWWQNDPPNAVAGVWAPCPQAFWDGTPNPPYYQDY